MRIIASPELDIFRDEVRSWLSENIPRDAQPKEGQALRDFDLAWQKTQFNGGWAGIAWPREYGGRGLSLSQQMIWYEEYSRANAPGLGSLFISVSHAGPTLIVKGSDDQKAFHLPRILKGEAIWCQGFSEPGAGSDLASLRTKGEIDGDHLVINGSKIWTTYGSIADYQELLVRTNPTAPKRKGISWVICDMKTPGITIRPIKAMSGLTHFCEVFYDDVRIPLSNIVGEIDQGWQVAMTTLGFERGTATISHQMALSRTVEKLIDIARSIDAPDGRRKAIDDDAIAAELATLRMDVAALRSLTILSISRGMRQDVPGAEGNIVALFFGELSRRVYQTAMTLLGPMGIERAGELGNLPVSYLESFKWGIGGGTFEIRRTTIGERILGLPKAKVQA